VRAGDTLTTTWVVTELIPKPKQTGGIVVLNGDAVNDDGVTVAQAVAKILVANAPAAGVNI
jgi:acyl dehydratase